jgi:hypothetical protein
VEKSLNDFQAQLRVLPTVSSAEVETDTPLRGRSSPETGSGFARTMGGRWGLPDCENAPAILWTALPTHLAAKARRSLRRSSTMATSM